MNLKTIIVQRLTTGFELAALKYVTFHPHTEVGKAANKARAWQVVRCEFPLRAVPRGGRLKFYHIFER